MKEGREGGEPEGIMGEAAVINSGPSGKCNELRVIIEQPVSAPNDS